MKKVILLLVLVILFLYLDNYLYSTKTVENTKIKTIVGSDAYTLVPITNEPLQLGNLVYDLNTKTVFYYREGHAAYMCPYLSNGKTCRFNVETQQIEEIP